jgi:hypothetical protein
MADVTIKEDLVSLLRNLRCAIRFWTLRLSFASVMDDQSSPTDPSDACVSFDWDVLELRYDMVLPLVVYRADIWCDVWDLRGRGVPTSAVVSL